VRLAPSLGGSADVKSAAEVRKVLPAGSAAILRPDEFGPLRNKVFPSIGTVHAEPDQSAWRRAAPSFGLRDAQPHTILSPDARIKPPHGGAPVPQIGAGGQTPMAKAISAASAVAPVVAAAKAGPAHRPVERALPHVPHAVPHIPAHAGSHPQGIHFQGFQPQGAGPAAFRSQAGPAAPSSLNYMPSFIGPVRPPIGMSRPGLPVASTPRFSMFGSPALPAAAASAASTSSRVASRFTPLQPSAGGGPTATVHEGIGSLPHRSLHPVEPTGFGHSTPANEPIPMSQPGGAVSPAIPAVRSGSSGFRPATSFGGFAKPSMTRPAVPTTARGGGYSPPSFGPAAMAGSYDRPASSTTSSWMPASGTYSRTPEMPIAASIPGTRSSSQPAAIIQRATHGGAVHANQTEHQNDTHEQTTNPQAQDPGAAAHEVNLLANEVWTLLKRKLLHESERLGKRY
ncbi:MAG TPA: hypothetical protein VG820_00875, partial [Fimbriimonadaceae bacterium]|nr:hypothetical protein [Fimbriimonadaceae bacterium]